MPITMTSVKPEPPTHLGEVMWEVWITKGEESYWVATCDTYDEALEVGDQIRKRYHITIESIPRPEVTP